MDVVGGGGGVVFEATELADEGEVGGGDVVLHVGGLEATDGDGHVGLAAAEPDVTDEDVFEREGGVVVVPDG